MQVQSYPGSAKGQNIAIILIVVAVIVLVFIIISKVFGGLSGFLNFFKGAGDTLNKGLAGLGLQDTPEQANNRKIINDAQSQASTVGSPFNPVYYKSAPKDTPLIYQAQADKLAKQIYDSVGYIYDDSLSGLAAFKQMTNKAIVSWVSDRFTKLYGQDMFNFLSKHYDTADQMANLVSIINYVNSLPAYK